MDGLDRGQFSNEVHKIEDQIRRRLPLGSRISERNLKEELLKQEFHPHAISKAIFVLTQKDILAYKDRRMSLVRIKI